MSTDNPFAAPMSDAAQGLPNLFRVEGTSLLCGPHTNVAFLCWLTGDRISPGEHVAPVNLRLAYWPAGLRRLVWLWPAVIILSIRFLRTGSPWMTVLLGGSWLIVPLVSRIRPAVTIHGAVSERGRSLRRKHNVSQFLRFVIAIGLAIVAIRSFALPLSPDLQVLANVLLPVGTLMLVMWLWQLIFPPLLSLKPPFVRDVDNNIFRVDNVPAAFLQGLQRELQPPA